MEKSSRFDHRQTENKVRVHEVCKPGISQAKRRSILARQVKWCAQCFHKQKGVKEIEREERESERERERGGGSRKKLTCSNAGQVGKMADHNQLIPKTIGNRKRDCAWGCAWGINTTWENLQIEKHKSVRWAERTPSWFVLFDLQIFSGGVYSPSATSRTISFSISNSFWY